MKNLKKPQQNLKLGAKTTQTPSLVLLLVQEGKRGLKREKSTLSACLSGRWLQPILLDFRLVFEKNKHFWKIVAVFKNEKTWTIGIC